jgi:hypothetical protein
LDVKKCGSEELEMQCRKLIGIIPIVKVWLTKRCLLLLYILVLYIWPQLLASAENLHLFSFTPQGSSSYCTFLHHLDSLFTYAHFWIVKHVHRTMCLSPCTLNWLVYSKSHPQYHTLFTCSSCCLFDAYCCYLCPFTFVNSICFMHKKMYGSQSGESPAILFCISDESTEIWMQHYNLCSSQRLGLFGIPVCQ